MKIHPAFLSALLTLLLLLPPAARADDANNAGVTVMATVRPKQIAWSDIKTGKDTEIIVTYVITNHTAETQIVNSYDTLKASISGDDGRSTLLRDEGADASRRISPPDILIIAPGRQQTHQMRVLLSKQDNGGIELGRYAESGEYWVGALPGVPKFMDINAIYANPLTRDQIEKLRPELKDVKYEIPEIKLPSVRLEIAE